MSEVSNQNWQDNSEAITSLPTPPSWEAQLHSRATELYAQRNAPIRAEIERLQVAFNEISARLVEQTTAAVSEQETAGILDYVKQWFSDSNIKAEEDFQRRLAQAQQEAELEFESRLAQLRSEWEAQRPSQDGVQQRLEQPSAEAARQIEELGEQVEGGREWSAMTVASSPAAVAQAGNFELLKTALEEIDAQRTQSDTLTALLRHAAQFAPRVAFFVVKGGEAVGWKAVGFENGLNDETVKSLSVSTQQPTLLREALTGAQLAVDRAETPDENSAVLGVYGSPAPERALAIPLVVRGKAAAVLYADSGTQAEQAINNAALEMLLRATSMAIELLPARRGVEPPARPAAPQSISQAAVATPAFAPTPLSEQPAPMVRRASAAESRAEVASSHTATSERTTGELHKPDEAENAVAMEAPAPVVAPVEPAAATTDTAPAREAEVEEDTDEASAPTLPILLNGPRPFIVKPHVQPAPFDSPAPPVSVEQPQPMEERTSPALPTVREEPARFTPSAPRPLRPPRPSSPTMPASETEQRAHNDARRFARLLISEIKLYNATKVNEGRRSLDLYERLRDEIERSRRVYDKRVAPAVAARFDYFYDELVQTLAEGDAVKLGANCPGPIVLSP